MKSIAITPTIGAWIDVARSIQKGNYRHCDDSLRQSLTIGLRSINDPTCREALAKLQADHEKDVEARKRKK